MAVKSKAKSKSATKKSKAATKAKMTGKKKAATKKTKPIRKAVSSVKPKQKAKRVVKKPVKKTASKTKTVAKKSTAKTVKKTSPKAVSNTPVKKAAVKASPKPAEIIRPVVATPPLVKRTPPPTVERRRVRPAPIRTTTQFNFMKAPTPEHEFEVGDTVEVFCDHEKSRERVRGWIRGIVVQVDNKMVAVQFRSNVFLTDGWMVPDRILWYPLNSEHIRPVPGKKSAVKKDFIPDY